MFNVKKSRYYSASLKAWNRMAIAALSIGTILFFPSTAIAVQLKITVESLAEEQGVFLSPFWVGLHDGSFDTFTPGEPASLPLEIVAEDGFFGLESTIPEFQPLLDLANSFNTTLPNPADTISNSFSSSTQNGLQSLAYAEVLGFRPGDQSSFLIDVDPTLQSTLSYAAMVVPTHDGFVADQDPVRLFSPGGVFQPQEIEIRGSDVYDAGTEPNAEDRTTTPVSFDPPEEFFATIRQGIAEGGTVQKHPLYKEPGEGGFLDIPQYSNADFTRAPDQLVARISVEKVPEPNSILATGLLLGLGILFKRQHLLR